jgi:hypothetical protein
VDGYKPEQVRNGLLRQYFPKSSDFSAHSAKTWTGSPPSSATDPQRD